MTVSSFAFGTGARSWRPARARFQGAVEDNAVERELDVFFETVASSGSKKVIKMTPEERAEMAARGAALEDDIYDLRDRLHDLESQFSASRSQDIASEIQQIRDEIAGLKDDYVLLVGADIPLYFGKALQ